jgi:hypothetical protein
MRNKMRVPKKCFPKIHLVQNFVVDPARTKKAGETPWHKWRVNFKNSRLTGPYRAYSVSRSLERAGARAL